MATKNISNLDKTSSSNHTHDYAASSHGTHVTYSTSAPKVAGTASAGSASNVSRGDHVHAAQTSVSGNAGTATTLQTARNIALGGLLSGSASFNGSANITISASIANPPKSGDWFSGGIPMVNTDGVMEIGKYIDFHNTDTSTNDFDVRLQAGTSTPCTITLPSGSGTLARTSDSITGNAATATKLATARTITIGNTGKTFDGSGNQSWTLSEIGAAAASHGTHLTIGTGSGNAAAGNHTHSSYATTTQLTTTNNNIGTLSNLQTSSKNNLVAAINEVFQSGSDAKTKLVNALAAKGISASTSDSWDTLIGKISNIAAAEGASNIYAATSLPATGNTNDICIVSSPLPNHIHIGRIKPTSVDANDIWLDTDGTDLSGRPYRVITVGKLSTNLRISSAYRLTSTGSYAAQVVAYYWNGSKWVVCCPTITTLKSTGSNSNGSISLGSSSKSSIASSGGISVTMQVKEGIEYTGKCTVRVYHRYDFGNSDSSFTYTIRSYNQAGTQLYSTSKTTTLGDEGYYYLHNVIIPEPGGYIQVIGSSSGSGDEFALYMNVTGNKA